MKRLHDLIERVITHTNISLRGLNFDVTPYVRNRFSAKNLLKFYAFYGITAQHPLHFHFSNSSLGGSYFLGKVMVENSVLYKSDVRGDELKKKGHAFDTHSTTFTLDDDELILVKNSFLNKTLVHNYSHNPEDLHLFLIKNTVAMPYSNIHGSSMRGAFIGPFATVDMTTVHDCVFGMFSYVQVGELYHQTIPPGKIWVKNGDEFDFQYTYLPETLKRYVAYNHEDGVMGMLMDYAEDQKEEFQKIFEVVNLEPPMKAPGAHISRYSVFSGKSDVGENVLVAQRAYLEDATLGKGSNAQENCYISHSDLEGFNVTAHGVSIVYSKLGTKVFVGFNSFLHGMADCPLTIGKESIIMPHTIIEAQEAITIPPNHLVWGHIREQKDLETNSISLDALSKVTDRITKGRMTFTGSGKAFVQTFRSRIEQILEANGAFYDSWDDSTAGHAQKNHSISFNIIQPYRRGDMAGIYPTITIDP